MGQHSSDISTIQRLFGTRSDKTTTHDDQDTVRRNPRPRPGQRIRTLGVAVAACGITTFAAAPAALADDTTSQTTVTDSAGSTDVAQTDASASDTGDSSSDQSNGGTSQSGSSKTDQTAGDDGNAADQQPTDDSPADPTDDTGTSQTGSGGDSQQSGGSTGNDQINGSGTNGTPAPPVQPAASAPVAPQASDTSVFLNAFNQNPNPGDSDTVTWFCSNGTSDLSKYGDGWSLVPTGFVPTCSNGAVGASFIVPLDAGGKHYVFGLTPVDNPTGSGQVVINVTGSQNQPPKARLSVTAGTGQQSLTVTADPSRSTDADGTFTSSIDWGDGSPATSDPTNAVVNHTYRAAGTYTVTLTVTDNDGATDTATKQVTVTAPPPVNHDPVAKTTIFTVEAGQSVSFTAGQLFGDPDGDVVTITGATGANHGSLTVSADSKTVTYTADSGYAGNDSFSVVGSDGKGGSATNTVTGTVTAAPPANQSPTAVFTAAQETGSRTVDFDGKASFDPDGTIKAYAWDFGDGATGTGVEPTHAYARAGTFNVTLTVTDDKGATGSVTMTVVVLPVVTPPTPAQPDLVCVSTVAAINGANGTIVCTVLNVTDLTGTSATYGIGLVGGTAADIKTTGPVADGATSQEITFSEPAGTYQLVATGSDLTVSNVSTVTVPASSFGNPGDPGQGGTNPGGNGGSTGPVDQQPQGDNNAPQRPVNYPSNGGQLASTGPDADLQTSGLLGMTVVLAGVAFTVVGRRRRSSAS